MSLRTIFLAILTLCAAMPAGAGIVMREVQSSESPTGGQRRTVMELSAEGDGLRSDIIESTNDPMMPPGSYMLIPSDELFYIVNPKNKSYMQMDMAVMAGMQQQGQRMQGQMKQQGASTSAENLTVTKKVDEAGPVMLGMPTQHVLYEVSYRRPMGMQVAGMSNSVEVHATYEIWATKGLEARFAGIPALKRSASRMGAPGGGMPDLKEVTEAIGSRGFALKKVVSSESKMHMGGPAPMMLFAKGASQESKTSSEITEIREQTLSPYLFVLPKDYTEVQMMNPNIRNMPDLNQLPGSPERPVGPKPPDNGAPPMPDLNKIPQ